MTSKNIKTIQEHSAFHDNRYHANFAVVDIRKQITVLIDTFGKRHMSRDKPASNATQRKRIDMLHHFVDQLRDKGYLLKNILNLDSRHIEAIVSTWKAEKLGAATIATYYSLLRWLVQCIGKAGMVMSLAHFNFTKEETARAYIAKSDKSWGSNNVDFHEVVCKVRQISPFPAIYLELCDAFGLRLQEAILIRPLIAWQGSTLNVVDGTKGGRPRSVPVRTDHQRDVLKRAIEMAKGTLTGSMVPVGRNLKQSLQNAYYIFRKVGITKAQSGISPHGLRHGYANDRYEEEAGVPSTVRGGDQQAVDREKDHDARMVVSAELGHSRVNILGAYTGGRKRGRPSSKACLPNPIQA